VNLQSFESMQQPRTTSWLPVVVDDPSSTDGALWLGACDVIQLVQLCCVEMRDIE
jgi:hypothetical protein